MATPMAMIHYIKKDTKKNQQRKGVRNKVWEKPGIRSQDPLLVESHGR